MWMALHLSVDGKGADWVTEPKGAIKKANLTFTAKFLWLLVHHCLSPTTVDNIVTWDRAVQIAAMIGGFEVDFAWLLQAVMYERDFKVTTTYPFPCMIFSLYRSACVPTWHVDQLNTPQGTYDVGLISNEDDSDSAQRGLELINVPYRHTYRPAKRKDHARERVSSCEFKSPLVHDFL